MAITLSTAARDAAASAVGTLCNGGSVVFLTAADAVVAACPLSATAFGAPSAGVITANAITSDTNTTAGTVAKFEVRDSEAAVVFSGTVTTSGGGGDAILTSLVFADGETLNVLSLTYTQPAS